MRASRRNGWLRIHSALNKKSITLPKSIFFLPDNFALDEEEGEKRSYHVIECSDLSHDIVVFDVPVVSDWELRSRVVDMRL